MLKQRETLKAASCKFTYIVFASTILHTITMYFTLQQLEHARCDIYFEIYISFYAEKLLCFIRRYCKREEEGTKEEQMNAFCHQ